MDDYDEFELLKSSQDFVWYKRKLDALAKYHHLHINEPTSYPCKVYSVWEDDPDGPYRYNHYFVYLEQIVCDKCGAKKEVWSS